MLLHGFLGSGRNLASLARAWSERDSSLRFWVPDLPGHGTSPALPAGADLAQVADIVSTTAARVSGNSPFVIVGHSLGGRVALAASLLAPRRMSSVVLLDIGPGPVPPDEGPATVLATLLAAPDRAENRREMAEHFLARGVSRPLTDWLLMNLVARDGQYRWRIDRERLAELHGRTSGEDLWPAVENPGSKVRLCVRGSRSRFVDEPDRVRLEAAGCRVVTLEDAGHFVHVDALDRLVDVLVTAPL